MRLLRGLSLSAVIALACAVPALGSMGGSSTPEPKQPATPAEAVATPEATARRQAELFYGDAYSEIAKAKRDVADKKKNVERRFKKALERAQRAVELDSTYHEAWNLIGYTSRKLKNYDQALAAYATCLRLAPDYAPAREYMGEALLELDRLDQAREQLAMLHKIEADVEATELAAAIDAYIAAHPETPGAPSRAATPDSTGSKP